MVVSGSATRRVPVVGWGLAIWFVLTAVLGWAGAFAPPAGEPPTALGLAAALPPLVAIGLLAGSSRFRGWARARDLHLLTTLQAWRAGGLAFLALAAVGAVPAGFAVPAGVGDILVGISAPLVATLLARGTLGSAGYAAWTVFGVLDLIVAVSLGVLYSDSAVGVLRDGVDTALMNWLPMSLVPTFFVPFLLVAHVLALAVLRARRSPSRAALLIDGPAAGRARGGGPATLPG